MYKIAFSLFLLAAATRVQSQQGHYLYIDSDNGQPFYVKLQDKIHSSSSSGYVIITGLSGANAEISIGFPGNRFPEQVFNVPVNDNDQGFHLKNAGDKGWELQHLNSLMVVSSPAPSKAAQAETLVKKTDAFSVMLSKVVNDPAVLIANNQFKEPPVAATPVPLPPAVPPVKRPDTSSQAATAAPAPVKDTSTVTIETPAPIIALKEPVKKDSLADTIANSTPPAVQNQVKANPPAVSSTPLPVRKLFDQFYERKYEATYIDQGDTVKISYPVNEDTVVITQPAIPATASPSIPAAGDSMVSAKPVQALPAKSCRLTANEQDVDNLRVKLLEAKNTDEKIAFSKLFFQSKCFTVKQVKALSELFAGDEDKYRFFDTAYPYTSDTGNFPTLAGLLKEDYYKNRFKAIIRQ